MLVFVGTKQVKIFEKKNMQYVCVTYFNLQYILIIIQKTSKAVRWPFLHVYLTIKL